MALPRAVEELTPEWLTSAIGSRHPGVVVTSVTIEKVIWGTATKVLAHCEYAGAPKAGAPPNKLCIKGEFDERIRKAFLANLAVTGTQVEADFYNDLAPRVGIPLPRHWFAGSEPAMGVLILDNMSADGTRFGTPTEPWGRDLVARALEILARLHAGTWDQPLGEIAWLQVGSQAVREAHEFLMSEGHWKNFQSLPDSFVLPSALADRARNLRALHVLWEHDDRVARCVIHGDAHLGNTCIDASGQPYFIDWAGPCKSSWAFDVSYFIVGAMTVADRRASEVELLRHYVDRLATFGGAKLGWDDAWLEYRRHHLPGLVWATLPSTMQSVENVHAMGRRYADAILDHETLRVLEG